MIDLTEFVVSADRPIREVIAQIDRNAKGLALVVDAAGRLVTTITDGDVRRAILAGVDLGNPVEALVSAVKAGEAGPITVQVGTPATEVVDLMTRLEIRHVPVVDSDGRVVDVMFLPDLVRAYELPLRALIMAGGYGTRLRPLTDSLPKGMLPVGDRPLLERIVRQLRDSGIRRVNLATHYRADVIEDHFGDGREFNVEIEYVNEDQPLGTAGALSLMAESQEPLLVINGDILTGLDFTSMLDFHRRHDAHMTVGVRPFEFQVPYGVVRTDGVDVQTICEKPVERYLINAGIYLLNPDVCRLVPAGQHYDMTDLIERLIAEGRRVISFPIREYWMDIGRASDYERARATATEKDGPAT
jgi:dTDP-glucose pyrophosphorylase